tara:strand:- start:409 stop:2853 length:2445 start_codon:yes stop_codon:yes gene_type:complete
MTSKLPFENYLDTILESFLDDRRKRSIDDIIQTLGQMRDADFKDLPGGVHAGHHYIDSLLQTSRSLRFYGQTAEDIEQIESKRQYDREQELGRAAIKKIQITACSEVEKQFPRFCRCLDKGFQFVQPNGQLEMIDYGNICPPILKPHGEDGPLETTGVSNDALVKLTKFFGSERYKQLASKVKSLRDFGFNVSGVLLNTDGAKFRTRYSQITKVILRYDGPYFEKTSANEEAQIKHLSTSGQAVVKTVPTLAFGEGDLVPALDLATERSQRQPQHNLTNVTLDHIGEIVDTIDMAIRGIAGNAIISEIQLMGTEVVEYQITVVLPTESRRRLREQGQYDALPPFTISSDEIQSAKDVVEKLYTISRKARGFNKQPNELSESVMKLRNIINLRPRHFTDFKRLAENTTPEAPPRRRTTPTPSTPKRDRPPKRSPWNPPQPKKNPAPKAETMEETFDRSVNPSTNEFWSNVRQSDHPFSKHPLMAMYGKEKAEKGWQKGMKSLKRIFPRLQSMDNPGALQQAPSLAMQAMQQVMQAESPFREELKSIAVDIVHEVWGIPPEMLDAQFTNQPGMEHTEHEEPSPEDIKRLRSQINKRITMNALTQGAAVQNMATIHHLAKERIESLSPGLMQMYDQFSSSSVSMYWLMDFANMANLASQAIGTSEVDFDGETPVVKAQAMVFPVLVQELVKGVMEVLSLHGLEDLDEHDTNVVYSQADRLHDEPWLIQVGPHLWDAFLKIIPKNHQLADVVANLAAKEPEFIHDLLSKTIEAVHSANDPQEQREILAQMMDKLDDTEEELDIDNYDDDSWDAGESTY